MSSFRRFLFREVDASSLAVFRIGFGIILLYRCLSYLFIECIECQWLKPAFAFKYYGFEWVQPLPGRGLHILVILMTLASIGVILGRFYRVCIVFFTLAFTYLFLLDQAYYLNHYYMVILFCAMLCVAPANRYLALDPKYNQGLGSSRIPYWPLFLMGAQLEIILIYAGLVKLNWDWLNLEPLRSALSSHGDFPILGSLFVQDWSVAVAIYGVIALHLVGAPLLLVKRTRLTVLIIYACFHTLNHFVFTIDIFPWMTLFASLLLFDPDWPKQFLAWLRRIWPGSPLPVPAGNEGSPTPTAGSRQALVTGFVVVWLLVQVLVPLRHWIYPGNVAWNEEGHRFSWRMKLRAKPGVARFFVTDERNDVFLIKPVEFVTPLQARRMVCIPDMILQFAHYLGQSWEANGHSNVKVIASVQCALNGRPLAPLVDSGINLYDQQRTLGYVDWVLPLKQPLPNPWLKP
jgi:hypothetical protein